MSDNRPFPANYGRAVIIGVSARDIGLDVRDERYRYTRQRKQCAVARGWPDNKRAGETVTAGREESGRGAPGLVPPR